MMQSNTASLSAKQKTAIRRWKLGHHILHLYLLTMNTELSAALEQLKSESWAELVHSLQNLARLYDAATASMKYTADIDPRDYKQLLRPSMSPPFVSPGFSGQQNSDHTTMVQLITRLRKEIKERMRRDDGLCLVPKELQVAARTLWGAQARNRRHHVFVCNQLVPGQGSLLESYFAALSRDNAEGEAK